MMRLCVLFLLHSIGFGSIVHAWSLKSYPSDIDSILSVPECEGLATKGSFGTSVLGRELQYMRLSEDLGNGATSRPAVRITGTIHGDEPLGTALLPALAAYLCESYRAVRSRPADWASFDTQPFVPDLMTEESRRFLAYRIVRDVDLYLIPVWNVDGYLAGSRWNHNKVDLNRDFPDPIRSPQFPALSGDEQPEVRAMIDLILSRRFVASTVLHEGAVVASYPYDGLLNPRYDISGDGYPANLTKDHATFKFLASSYAEAHAGGMATSGEFREEGGTTNGADWYPIYGGSGDFNYLAAQTMELTLELAVQKKPHVGNLEQIYNENLAPLLLFPWMTTYGGLYGNVVTRGPVLDKQEKKPRASTRKLLKKKGSDEEEEDEEALFNLIPVSGASIQVVAGSPLQTTSGPISGEFFRPLAPGKYKVTVTAPGYKRWSKSVTIPDDFSGFNLQVELQLS